MVEVVVAQADLAVTDLRTHSQALAALEYRIVFLEYQIGMQAVEADRVELQLFLAEAA
jgi:hypothetical protein